MTAFRTGIRIIISSPGDLVEERTRFHGIVAVVMAKDVKRQEGMIIRG